MSFNILGDHGLNINIQILKKVREFVNGNFEGKLTQAIDIPINAVSSLKLEDNLINTGMKGIIEINNDASILDQLGIATKSSDDLYISISIKDPDLESAGLNKHQAKIEFLGMIEQTVTGSANFQDNVVIFKFEEAFVAEMRHTSWDSFFKSQTAMLGAGAASALKTSPVKVTDLVKAYYKANWLSLNPEIENTSIVVDTQYFPVDALPIIVNTKVERPMDESSGGSEVKQLIPSFRFNNDEVSGIRKMTFKPYFTDRHRAFIREVKEVGIQGSGDAANDYSDVYLEKFTCGPLAQFKGSIDPNTNWHNSIEGESITRPDIGKLRKELWCNFIQINAKKSALGNEDFDITANTAAVHLYANAAVSFIKDELGLEDEGINLPLLDAKSQTKQYFFTPGDQPNSDEAIINELYNKIKKSFVTVNEQISFKSKGAIYRTPGKFIWVERSEEESLLQKLWYVNSVEHIFINGSYNTEIIANRVFGDNKVKAFEALAEDSSKFINGVIEDKAINRGEQLVAAGVYQGPALPPAETAKEKIQELENKTAQPPVAEAIDNLTFKPKPKPTTTTSADGRVDTTVTEASSNVVTNPGTVTKVTLPDGTVETRTLLSVTTTEVGRSTETVTRAD